MECKKENLIEVFKNNHGIFHEKYGLSVIYIKSITIKQKNGLEVDSCRTFLKKNNNYISISNYISYLNEIFNSEDKRVYIPKKEATYPYYNRSSLGESEVQEIQIESIILGINISFSDGDNNDFGSQAFEQISFNNFDEILNHKFWAIPKGTRPVAYKKPLLREIKLDNLFYYVGCGVVKVLKLFDYPDKNNKFCVVQTLEGEEITISTSLEHLYCLPYKQPKNDLAFLDKNVNELLLSPFIACDGQTYNVYWKPIDEAAEYIISLYKYVEQEKRIDVYHLKDYVVNRGDRFLTIPNLVGRNFIFKVAAEDREGKVLAMSRGIKYGYPNFLNEENR